MDSFEDILPKGKALMSCIAAEQNNCLCILEDELTKRPFEIKT